MKKILLSVLLIVLLLQMVSCSVVNQGDNMTTPENSISNTTNKPVEIPKDERPYVFPASPEGLTEKVRYESTSDGLFIIKGFFDAKNNCVEEHYYTIDGTLGILDCTIVAYNTLDKDGNIIKSEGHYIKNPYYGAYETVLTVISINEGGYDYKTVDADGNVRLYIKETKDVRGNVVKEEYYDVSGRLLRTEESEYYDDGILKVHRSLNAQNQLTYECEYNKDGNFVSGVCYENSGAIACEMSAAYYESGSIQKYTVKLPGTEQSSHIWFNKNGNIISRPYTDYLYNSDGALEKVMFQFRGELFLDEKGYITKYRSYVNGTSANTVDTTYSYNNEGKITSAVSFYNITKESASVKYEYADDGSLTVTTEDKNGIQKSVIYMDAKGRLVKSENYSDGRRTKYQVYEYDVRGNVIRIDDYNLDNIYHSEIYQYNRHDDVIRKESINYSFTENMTFVQTYEYYDHGALKVNTEYDYGGNKTRQTEYHTDGGYTVTEYRSDQFYMSYTYNILGQTVKEVYRERASYVATLYTYYESGAKKSEYVYYDDVLKKGEEYSEGGAVVLAYELREDGYGVAKLYDVSKGSNLIREELYKNETLVSYKTYEYFVELSTPVIRFEKEFDASGELIYYLENARVDYGSWFNYEPIREEHYENGVMTSYLHSEYDSEGMLCRQESLKDGVLSEIFYTYNQYERIIRKEIYVEGKLFLYTVYDQNREYNECFSEKTYNAADQLIEFLDYIADIKYCYEYYASGALHMEYEYTADDPGEIGGDPDTENVLIGIKEYTENGDILSEEKRDVRGNITYRRVCKYDSQGKLISEEYTEKNVDYRKVYFYNEAGKQERWELYKSGVFYSYCDFKYHTNGVISESDLRYHGSPITTTDELLKYDLRGNLVSKYTAYRYLSNGKVYVNEGKYTYAYNENDRLTEERYVAVLNGEAQEETRKTYEYHANGQVSLYKFYIGETLYDSRRYDENGEMIFG